jgi:pilus assembly protein CpaF
MSVPVSLAERVRSRLAASETPLGAEQLTALARKESNLLVDSAALAELTGELSADLLGAGPLEPLLALAGVTDVLVNSAAEVWVDRDGVLQRSAVRFADDQAVRRLAMRLAAQAGRRLDDAAPYVDASLPDGTRLHAMLPPLVAHPTICLRVLARRRLGIGDLIERGALDERSAALLVGIVRARLSLLISGGTGTGKTTLLAALLSEADPGDRILTIEDAAELAIEHPHVVALLARTSNIEGAGAVTLRELVRQALRMRGDRLVVGEFRGAELAELLAALNTGHSGGAATVHANSVLDVGSRLVALAALGGMSAQVLRAQAASALDVLVHVRRDSGGRRRLAEVALWPRAGTEPVPVWSMDAGIGPGWSRLQQRLADAGVSGAES